LFGRLRNLSKAALEQYFATGEAQRSTRITLIAEIANAWLSLAADQEQLLITRENLSSLDQTRSLTQAQFRIGTPRSSKPVRRTPIFRLRATMSPC